MRSYAPASAPQRRPAKYGLALGTRVRTSSGRTGQVLQRALEAGHLVYEVLYDEPIRSTSRRRRPPVTSAWISAKAVYVITKDTP